jgi:hypothetical protein
MALAVNGPITLPRLEALWNTPRTAPRSVAPAVAVIKLLMLGTNSPPPMAKKAKGRTA